MDELTYELTHGRESTRLPHTHKGEGSLTTRIGLVNRGKIKVNEQKRHSAFLSAENFYFQDRHLFFCVDPLLLCYRVLNMGRVALF